MIHKLAVLFITYFMKYNTQVELLPNTPLSYMDKPDMEESAVYGMEMLISSILNLLIIGILGLIFQKVPQTFIFLLCFCTLRPYAGGYHAPNYLLCSLSFTIMYCIIVLNPYVVNEAVVAVMFGLSAGIIWILSPVEDLNKPLGTERRSMVQKKARILLLVEVIAFIITSVMHNQMVHTFIAYAVCYVALLMLAGQLKLHRTACEEHKGI